MPLLYGSITGGKALAILFFISICFAGLSSLISIIERPVRVLEDFGSMLKRTEYYIIEIDVCTMQFGVFLVLFLSLWSCLVWALLQP